jgi:hypothetical protein
MDFKETECKSVDWIRVVKHSIQWRTLESTVMNLKSSLKNEEYLKELGNYQLLKKDPAPRSYCN